MSIGTNNLGLDGISIRSQSAEAAKLTNAHSSEGVKSLQLDGITINDRFIVTVKGIPVSQALPSRALAEQFVQQLPVETQNEARIVPATNDGKQVLLG